jgi:hypothetical protein
MAKRGRKAKGADAKKQERFESLGGEWCDAIKGKESEELKKEVGRVAMASAALKWAQKADQDLANLKEQVQVAGAVYKDGLKANDIQIEYMIDQLNYRGVEIPSMEDFLRKAADGDVDG